MNVLITGAAGFIGSHLAEMMLLDTAHALVCVDNFCDYYSPSQKRENIAGFVNDERVKFHEGDIGDSAVMTNLMDDHRVDAVIHLAAHAGVTPSVASPRRYFENNVLGTLALLEAARRHPLARFIFVSSSTVYGVGCPVPFREDAPSGTPTSPYGASKRAAELVCQTYHQLHAAPTVILRPFSVYGPRLRPDLALSVFARQILSGEEITVFGDGSVRRDFTHVADISRGLIAALEAPHVVGECINLGHDEPLSMREVLEHLQAAFDRRARIAYRPPRAEDLPVTHADLTKAQTLLGYRPAIGFADGIRDFAAWCQRPQTGL